MAVRTCRETSSSFANTDGGKILLGVKEENHKFAVVDVDDACKILTDFWNTVNGDKVGGVVVYERGVTSDAVGGKQIVVVEVPRHQDHSFQSRLHEGR